MKKVLNNEEFRLFVKKVNELVIDNMKLNAKIDQLLTEKENSQKKAKNKEIEHTMAINSLHRENDVLKGQVR